MMTDQHKAIYLTMQETRSDVLLKLRERPFYLLGLLVAFERPLTVQELSTFTGWSVNTVATALRLLDHHGLAIRGRERGPWVPTASGRQLVGGGQPSTTEGGNPLGRGAPKGSTPPTTPYGTTTPPPPPATLKPALKLGVDSTPPTEGQPSVVEDSTPLNQGVDFLGFVDNKTPSVVEGGTTFEKNDPQSLRVSQDRAELRKRQRWLACREVGINAPALDNITLNDRIDPIFIFAHAIDCKNQSLNRGALVYRITHYWTPSRQAIHEAEGKLISHHPATCKHCDHHFMVQLDLGDEPSDFVFDCPQCGQAAGEVAG